MVKQLETTKPKNTLWRRVFCPIQDGVIFIALWWLTMEVSGVRFPFGLMQNFARQDYDAYIYVMTRLTLGLYVLSILMHRLVGGSIGKWLMGVRTIQTDGQAMTWRQIILRSSYFFLVGLLILAPGPMVAFVYGKGSATGSLIALGLGLLLLVLTTFSYGRPQSLIEWALGIQTVRC